jgi:hypothetical protein
MRKHRSTHQGSTCALPSHWPNYGMRVIPAIPLVAALIAGCAPLAQAPQRTGPRVIVEDGAVRSVFFPQPVGICRFAPCAGPAPAEYAAHFRRELALAGFDVGSTRGDAAPVIRIRVDHIATTPTECDMAGSAYVADNVVDIKRTYTLSPPAYPTRAGAEVVVLPPRKKREVLRACLAAYAKTVGEALATGASR